MAMAGAERHQDVHHERGRSPTCCSRREDGPGGGIEGPVDVHRREGDEGLLGGPQARQARLGSSDTAELVFDGCRVPAANCWAKKAAASTDHEQLPEERIAIGSMAIGESARRWRSRSSSEDPQGIRRAALDKQAIRQRLAMLAAKVEAAGSRLARGVARTPRAGCVKEVSMVKATAASW